jgi:hypothetical protein
MAQADPANLPTPPARKTGPLPAKAVAVVVADLIFAPAPEPNRRRFFSGDSDKS